MSILPAKPLNAASSGSSLRALAWSGVIHSASGKRELIGGPFVHLLAADLLSYATTPDYSGARTTEKKTCSLCWMVTTWRKRYRTVNTDHVLKLIPLGPLTILISLGIWEHCIENRLAQKLQATNVNCLTWNCSHPRLSKDHFIISI